MIDLISINITKELRHPFYKLMELKSEALKIELAKWSRLDLIEWLSWNDRNGIYSDEDSMAEFGNVLSKEEAISIIIKQISISHSDDLH